MESCLTSLTAPIWHEATLSARAQLVPSTFRSLWTSQEMLLYLRQRQMMYWQTADWCVGIIPQVLERLKVWNFKSFVPISLSATGTISRAGATKTQSHSLIGLSLPQGHTPPQPYPGISNVLVRTVAIKQGLIGNMATTSHWPLLSMERRRRLLHGRLTRNSQHLGDKDVISVLVGFLLMAEYFSTVLEANKQLRAYFFAFCWWLVFVVVHTASRQSGSVRVLLLYTAVRLPANCIIHHTVQWLTEVQGLFDRGWGSWLL